MKDFVDILSKGCNGDDYTSFKAEDEAIAFDGRAVGMSQLCQAERDGRILKKQKGEIRDEKNFNRYFMWLYDFYNGSL